MAPSLLHALGQAQDRTGLWDSTVVMNPLPFLLNSKINETEMLKYHSPDCMFDWIRQDHIFICQFPKIHTRMRALLYEIALCLCWTKHSWLAGLILVALWQGHLNIYSLLSICIMEWALFKCNALFLACDSENSATHTERVTICVHYCLYFHGMGIAAKGTNHQVWEICFINLQIRSKRSNSFSWL